MSEEEDRISALPDAILHQILSFLPTKNSIQASILSKRWINLWKFTPSIDIQMEHPGPYNYQITPTDMTFIHNILSQHQAMKLHKFRLIKSDGYIWDIDIEHCIEFAILRQVQILSLSAGFVFFNLQDYCVLPDIFYSHDNVRSIEQVSLEGFSFNLNPPNFLPFASLKTLCFFDCVIDDETLKALLSNCPILETLKIDLCHELLNVKASWCQSMRLKHVIYRRSDNCALNLEIDVASVSTVKVHGDLLKISFGSFSSIVEATVFQRSYNYLQDLHIRTWLQNLARVKKLGVGSWFSQFLARELKVNNSKVWNIYENLKVFSWVGPLRKECDLIALIAFLGHCPLLETINIDFRYISMYWEEDNKSIPPLNSSDSFVEMENGDEQVTMGSLLNVKEIMVHHFFGYKSEMEFIKHLLQKSIVVETLSLTYHRLEFNPETFERRPNSPAKELVEEEVFSLPRASSLVHILFHHTFHKVGF